MKTFVRTTLLLSSLALSNTTLASISPEKAQQISHHIQLSDVEASLRNFVIRTFDIREIEEVKDAEKVIQEAKAQIDELSLTQKIQERIEKELTDEEADFVAKAQKSGLYQKVQALHLGALFVTNKDLTEAEAKKLGKDKDLKASATEINKHINVANTKFDYYLDMTRKTFKFAEGSQNFRDMEIEATLELIAALAKKELNEAALNSLMLKVKDLSKQEREEILQFVSDEKAKKLLTILNKEVLNMLFEANEKVVETIAKAI